MQKSEKSFSVTVGKKIDIDRLVLKFSSFSDFFTVEGILRDANGGRSLKNSKTSLSMSIFSVNDLHLHLSKSLRQ